MDDREFELRYKRMWSEYTDTILQTSRACEDRDFAVEALVEEAKNAHRHLLACADEILKVCPELQGKTLMQIITQQIPFIKLRK